MTQGTENEKAPHFLRSTVLFVLVEITGPIQITVTLLQSHARRSPG